MTLASGEAGWQNGTPHWSDLKVSVGNHKGEEKPGLNSLVRSELEYFKVPVTECKIPQSRFQCGVEFASCKGTDFLLCEYPAYSASSNVSVIGLIEGGLSM